MAEVPSVVAIVGAGLIGRCWAMVFARAGSQVRLWDPVDGVAEAARVWVTEEAAAIDATQGTDWASAIASRLTCAPSLQAALDGAVYAQESGPERVDIKRALFAEMDALAAPDCILASSTSTIPTSQFASDLPGRGRALVCHPANPPHLLPAVEVAPADWHDPAFVQRVCEVLTAVGQWPVPLKKEIPGFVMNRLQAAVINHAVSLVADGVVDADGLDRILSGSIGRRWAFLGPFETTHLNAPGGFLDYAERYGPPLQALGEGMKVSGPWPDHAVSQIAAAVSSDTPVSERQTRRDRILLQLKTLLEQESRP